MLSLETWLVATAPDSTCTSPRRTRSPTTDSSTAALRDGGVWVADSSNDNRFEGNVAQGNDYEGFAIAFGSSGNTLVHNVSRGSNYEGISLYFGADHNVVRDNTVVENRTSGVLVYESSYNVITGTRAFRNNLGLFEGSAGISVVEGSSDNEMAMNVACTNGLADAYDDHSGAGNVWIANKFCTSDI